MAAGKGTRMKSATPKVLQPVLDRPIIDYVIKNILSVGISPENIGVLVGSGGEQVASHVNKAFPGVKILWQHNQLGTGHAVKCAREWWQSYENLIVLNGDLPMMTPESLKELISCCNQHDCTVITFNAANPGAYGRIIRENNHVSIIEFKDATLEQIKIREVNAGCYAFRVKALESVIDLITNHNAQKEYYLTDALALMNSQGFNTGAFTMPEEEMQGVNNQRELAEVSRVMRDKIINRWLNEGVRILDINSVYIGSEVILAPDVVIMPNVQIFGTSIINEGSYIGSGSILNNAVLGRNVKLTAYVFIENSELKDNAQAGPFCYIRDNSCLENNSFAGKFVELKNSHIGENSKVPHLSYMGDADLGSNVNIGAGSITCNYDGSKKNHTRVGDNCFIGSDTMLVAPVEVESNSATAAGSVITQRVPENALGVGRARQINIENWVLRRNLHKQTSTSQPEGDK
ncbi:MAG: bifunctional UDP-N-acetylglucosamine diphosphorylase/glucosamine-1-phosphate N-acetyltransferase GlmU [Synergistaceae bacterium]|nr:bifunctional UDP-N-acetylglucosamine diphosphorylase/glucosamine-1-phosphate N-acetyltransferase GlmU [Synergistaceae bacterium]